MNPGAGGGGLLHSLQVLPHGLIHESVKAHVLSGGGLYDFLIKALVKFKLYLYPGMWCVAHVFVAFSWFMVLFSCGFMGEGSGVLPVVGGHVGHGLDSAGKGAVHGFSGSHITMEILLFHLFGRMAHRITHHVRRK